MTIMRYSPPFALWVVGGAVLTSFYGPLAILNPFRHLLSMVAAMRYLVQWLLGPQPPFPLLPIETVEAVDAVAGLFGLAGWFMLMIAIFVRYGVTDI